MPICGFWQAAAEPTIICKITSRTNSLLTGRGLVGIIGGSIFGRPIYGECVKYDPNTLAV